MSKAGLDVIKEVRELYREPSNWIKGSFARDALGKPVPVKSQDACCWCLMGAVCKYANAYVSEDALKLIDKELPAGRIIVEFNDTYGYEAVCDLLDKIIRTHE